MKKKRVSPSKLIEKDSKTPQKLVAKVAKTRTKLRKELHAKKGKLIPAKKLAKAAEKDGKIGKDAQFAESFKKFIKTKRKK